MADYSAKLGYGTYDQIISKIQSGVLDERDIVFTSDTSEIVYITDSKVPQVMRARLQTFDNVDSAVNTLNHQSSTYPGQLIGIKNASDDYEPYVVWKHGTTYSVRRLTLATETEQLEVKTDEHIEDGVRHITAAEREAWNAKVETEDLDDYNAHLSNTEIHTTNAERAAYQAHIQNADIHTTAVDKENYDSHIDNDTIHVTQADKNKWNSNGTNYESVEAFIADLSTHNVADAIHVFFPAAVISSITSNKITSPCYGLMCRTASGRYDLTLYADGYMIYMVRMDENGNVSRVSRATLSTVS